MTRRILIVEDEEHDAMFMRLALESSGVRNPLVMVPDGQQAWAYLNGDGKYADRKTFPLPDLMFLDLKLPRIPGLEVLRRVRAKPELASLPIIIFSSSNQDRDVEAAYSLGADGYIVKPAYSELVEVARLIKKYWLEMDAPPANCPEWLALNEPRPIRKPKRI